MRAQPLASNRGSAAAACADKQSVSAPTWKHADCGQLSTERRREVASRGSRHAGRGAERGGEGWRLTCACRALRPSLRAVRWKEGAVAAVRRARLRASWAAAMATLLGTRRSWGWRKGGAAAGETGARIGGARAAGSGAAKPFAAVRRSRKRRGFGGHGALAGARRSHQRWRRGRALHRRAGGQDSVTTGRDRPPDSANRALCSHVPVASIFPKKSWCSHRFGDSGRRRRHTA